MVVTNQRSCEVSWCSGTLWNTAWQSFGKTKLRVWSQSGRENSRAVNWLFWPVKLKLAVTSMIFPLNRLLGNIDGERRSRKLQTPLPSAVENYFFTESFGKPNLRVYSHSGRQNDRAVVWLFCHCSQWKNSYSTAVIFSLHYDYWLSNLVFRNSILTVKLDSFCST